MCEPSGEEMRETFFVEFSSVERGVVKVANGEGDDVGSNMSKVVSSPHEVHGEGHLGVKVEM